MAESIQELTRAIASGDTEAFARFYRAWFDFAFSMARQASGRDEQFCLDIVQESMMRVIRSMKPMETEAGLRAWLRLVVRSCCCDQLRREMRRRRREAGRAIHSQAHETKADHDLQDRLAWLNDQLMRLAPQEARLLTMRYRLGWTLKCIGSALGLKPGAVDGRIGRVLAAMRENGQENFDE